VTLASPLFFATSNDYKFFEFKRLFAARGVTLEHINLEVQEIQTIDIAAIIKDKVVKAYSKITRPVLVDHSGFSLEALKGLPQGLNKQFWAVLKDEVCEVAAQLGNNRATTIVYLGLCDGRRIHTVVQDTPGLVPPRPAPGGTFHLDRVFVPDGYRITLAEMTEGERDSVPHRAAAADKAVLLLRTLELGRLLGL
jgi:XTP/dITP diphosphohydrolase